MKTQFLVSDARAERLRELTEAANNIAAKITDLVVAPNQSPETIQENSTALLNEVEIEIDASEVTKVIRLRRLRDRFFPSGLFADPTWDMLLDLFRADLSHVRVSLTSLCGAAGVPASTALRLIHSLVERDLLVRRSDPHDRRRVFVEMSPQTGRAMRSYFRVREATALK